MLRKMWLASLCLSVLTGALVAFTHIPTKWCEKYIEFIPLFCAFICGFGLSQVVAIWENLRTPTTSEIVEQEIRVEYRSAQEAMAAYIRRVEEIDQSRIQHFTAEADGAVWVNATDGTLVQVENQKTLPGPARRIKINEI